MSKRSKKELLNFLQENNIARVSVDGLLEKHPDAIHIVKYICLTVVEDYEAMPVIDNFKELIESKYYLFLTPDNRYSVFEIKEHYHQKEFNRIIQHCGITA